LLLDITDVVFSFVIWVKAEKTHISNVCVGSFAVFSEDDLYYGEVFFPPDNAANCQ